MTATLATTLRPAEAGNADDEAFLRRVFAEASNAALSGAGLPPLVLRSLLDLQYDARLAQWRAAYPSLVRHVVERDGAPVGVCLLADDENAGAGAGLRVVDLAVLPAWQRQGVASDVLRELAGRGRPIRLSVWSHDPGARAVYDRAGFREDEAHRSDPDGGYTHLVLDPMDRSDREGQES